MKDFLESIQILNKYTCEHPTVDFTRKRLVLKGLDKKIVSYEDIDRLSYLDVFFDEDEGYFIWVFLDLE